MLGKTAATVITATETNPGRTAQEKVKKEVSDRSRDGGKVQPDENNEDVEQTDSNRTIDQTQESNRTIDQPQENNRTTDQTRENNRTDDQTRESNRTDDQTQEETMQKDSRGQGNEENENRDQAFTSIATDQRRKFDTNSLILNCVQRALSALKDPKEDVSRTTQRLKIVLNLLKNDKGRFVLL